jgi:4-hydroxythreonine-4-phosphate dehydrogenase
LLGDEERRIIAPAVRRAARRGITVSGPHSADTLFYRAAHGQFDAVVAMYHDQGLAPFKLIAFDNGVNLTLGLPFVRTSPDHGTAPDIAGKSIARPDGMIAAINMAGSLAARR